MYPTVKNFPVLTTEQMIEVDRAMIEDYHILLIQMMENAGLNLARLARKRFLEDSVQHKHVTVLAGTGGNGGGAMVAARRLHNWGAKLSVFLTREPQGEIPRHQYDALKRMGLNLQPGLAPSPDHTTDLIIDGIIGYSLQGNPIGVSAEMINWANQYVAPTLALDTPSGIDLTSGTIYEPVIQAVATLTLALPKTGLFSLPTAEKVGELFLADISVPPALYANKALNLQVGHLFSQSEILRLAPKDPLV